MIKSYHTVTTSVTTPAAADLDALLAPLDDVARVAVFGEPTPEQYERAYALAVLSAELLGHAPSGYLLACVEHLGVEQGDALTIGRAISGLMLRLSGWVEESI